MHSKINIRKNVSIGGNSCEHCEKVVTSSRLTFLFKKRTPDNYVILYEIGYGKYSRVFKASDKKGRRNVVLKVLNPTPIRRIIREISIINLLCDGPNIVKLYDVVANPMVNLHFKKKKKQVTVWKTGMLLRTVEKGK